MTTGGLQPKPWLFKRKRFWDNAEYLFGCLAGIGATITARSTQTLKATPSTWTGIFVAFVLVAKLISREITERAEKDRQEETKRLRDRYADQSRRMIGAILDDLKTQYFKKVADDKKFENRVTLFVSIVSGGIEGTERRLEIFARSGRFPESRCSWPLDDNIPEKCRGIAGQVWFNETTLVRQADCDWPKVDDPGAKARYAESLGITVAEAEALNVKSRAFAGTPIEVGGKRWGVLLLDGLGEGHIVDTTPKRSLINRYASLIGSALEGAQS